MAARKPAIQARQGHPQGIVDDVAKLAVKGIKKVVSKGAKVPSRRAVKGNIIARRRVADYNTIRKNTPWHGPSDAEIAKAVAKHPYRVSRKTVSDARKTIAARGEPASATRRAVKKAYPVTSGKNKAVVKQMRKEKLATMKENANYTKQISRMSKQKGKRLSANEKTTIAGAAATGGIAAGTMYATRKKKGK